MTALITTLLALCLALSAHADSSRALSLDELIDGAEEIVAGEVTRSEGRWEGRLVVTDTTVRVDESLKGRPPREVTITELGGTAVHPKLGARVTTQASGATPFRPGEHVILFVGKQRGERRLVGGAQGKLLVAGDGDKKVAQGKTLTVGPKVLTVEPGAGGGTITARGMTLDELRARVKARSGGGSR